MFKKLFGSSGGSKRAQPSYYSAPPGAAQAPNPAINAIHRLEEQSATLQKRVELLEKRADEQLQLAKQFSAQGKKPQALQHLKRKGMYLKQIEQARNLMDRLDEQRMGLESQNDVGDTVIAIADGVRVAQEAQKNLNVDKIDKVMDDAQEQHENQREINDRFQTPMGLGLDLDMDDAERELEELAAQQLDEQLLQPAPVPISAAKAPAGQALPSVPQAAKQQPAKSQEELELEALQAEMAA